MAEQFLYKCPHCLQERNAIEVAEALPDEVLRLVAARRNARLRKTRSMAGGRPTLARCPGCSQEMSAADLRDHRILCVRSELEKLRGMEIQLSPKDPDPYPNFYLNHVYDGEVEFMKGSNNDCVTIALRKIADITITEPERTANVRVLGRVVWRDDIKRWRFAPTAPVGRPKAEVQE